jgi:hypothetical protein
MKHLLKKATTLLPIPFLLAGCFNIPVTCDTNQRTTYAPVEIRNQTASYLQPYEEYYTCYLPNNTVSICQRNLTRWVEGSLEWRDKDKYSNPDEGWQVWHGDPKKSDDGTSAPYRVTVEADRVICDNRDSYKDRNGEIIEHRVKTTIYVPNQ